jgi:hypothetical protein
MKRHTGVDRVGDDPLAGIVASPAGHDEHDLDAHAPARQQREPLATGFAVAADRDAHRVGSRCRRDGEASGRVRCDLERRGITDEHDRRSGQRHPRLGGDASDDGPVDAPRGRSRRVEHDRHEQG